MTNRRFMVDPLTMMVCEAMVNQLEGKKRTVNTPTLIGQLLLHALD